MVIVRFFVLFLLMASTTLAEPLLQRRYESGSVPSSEVECTVKENDVEIVRRVGSLESTTVQAIEQDASEVRKLIREALDGELIDLGDNSATSALTSWSVYHEPEEGSGFRARSSIGRSGRENTEMTGDAAKQLISYIHLHCPPN